MNELYTFRTKLTAPCGFPLAALPGSPAEFGKLIADDTEKWGKVVKYASIKAD